MRTWGSPGRLEVGKKQNNPITRVTTSKTMQDVSVQRGDTVLAIPDQGNLFKGSQLYTYLFTIYTAPAPSSQMLPSHLPPLHQGPCATDPRENKALG